MAYKREIMLRLTWVRGEKTDSSLSGRRNGGFSLIEMAIVLVIITTVLTLGLGTLTTVLSSANYAETRKRQDRIKDALIAYLGANRRLPCPAKGNPDGDLATSDTTGVEDCSTLPGLGIVPYRTLGLGREVAEDGWQNFFSYQVSGSSSNCTTPAYNTTDVNWTNAGCFGAGKNGGLTLTWETPAPPASPVTTAGIVAVIISHGANGLRAWTRQGTRNADPATCEEAHNSLASSVPGCTLVSNMFYKGEREGNDDVVAYLTRDDIIQPLAKQGAILSAPAQVNDDLQGLLLKRLTECTAGTTDPDSPLDPWGTKYKALGDTNYPTCYCTGVGAPPPTTCPGTTANCQSLGVSTINGYRTKVGLANCT